MLPALVCSLSNECAGCLFASVASVILLADGWKAEINEPVEMFCSEGDGKVGVARERPIINQHK